MTVETCAHSFILKQNQMIWPKDQPKTIWKNRIIYTGVVKLLLTGGIIKWFSAWVNNWAGWHIAMMEKSRGKSWLKSLSHSFFCLEPIFRKKCIHDNHFNYHIASTCFIFLFFYLLENTRHFRLFVSNCFKNCILMKDLLQYIRIR